MAHGLGPLVSGACTNPWLKKMLENGGLVSDFMSGTDIERQKLFAA